MRPIGISIYHKICQELSEIFTKLITSGVTDDDFLERMSMLQNLMLTSSETRDVREKNW